MFYVERQEATEKKKKKEMPGDCITILALSEAGTEIFQLFTLPLVILGPKLLR